MKWAMLTKTHAKKVQTAPPAVATPHSNSPSQSGAARVPLFLQPATHLVNQAEASNAPDSEPLTNVQPLVSSLLPSQPSLLLPAPDGGRPIGVYETPAAQQAADRLGAFGFAYQDRIFLGRNPGLPGAPDRQTVLQHEMVHVLQSRQRGPVAGRDDLERQAGAWRGGQSLLTASPSQAYGWLWVPFVLAAGYILLKPNTANAPGPGDPTYKSMDTVDYAKMVTEATLLAAGGGIATGLRKARYSVVTTWGLSGAFGSISYRATQDIFSGSFSGIDAYVVDGLTGATVGVMMGGTFYALGKVPGISRARDWFMRGAENDEAWAEMYWSDRLRYEIGQKTLSSAEKFATVSQLSPNQRGAQFIQQQGWLRALFPNSPKFLPGTGGTFGTGPTPGARWFFRSAAGFGAGATGNHLFGEPVRNTWGTGMQSYGSSAGANSFDNLFGGSVDADMQPGASGVPVIIVVPAGEELNYLIKTGRVGDFPVPDGTSGLRDAPREFSPDVPNARAQPRDMMG